jgi:hypothetical protein
VIGVCSLLLAFVYLILLHGTELMSHGRMTLGVHG